MTEADSILRDLWRVGLLLTGSEAGATSAVLRVLAANENVLKLSEARRRRLVVMGAREWEAKGATGCPEGQAVRAGHASQRGSMPYASDFLLLEPTQREAWVLKDVLGWDEVEVARATGVSKGALAMLLAEASRRLGDAARETADALRAWVDAADVRAGVEEACRRVRTVIRRKRLVGAGQVVLLLAAFGLLAWIGADLMRANQRERERRALEEAFSNPMPAEAAKDTRRRESDRIRLPAGSGGGP